MEILEEKEMILEGDLLLEISLSNMKNNVRRDFGPERESRSNRVNVVNYDIIPSLGEKTLLIKSRIRGETGNYQPQIRFTNVAFSPDQKPNYVPIKAVDGTDLFVRQFTAAQTQAKVKCNCLDFYYRFAVWNHAKKGLEGDPPPPYVKKTDRPPVNPNKVPGSCKHIMKLVTFLRTEQILR